jgi:predicted Ser/Thr protein kinase
LSDPVARIGKYQIIAQVGEGAMGVVYRAMDSVLNRHVAIKVMSEGIAQDAGLRERFLREAQAAGSLQHPNVVTIYDFGEVDGHLFIAMEFIEGADLEHLLTHKAPLTLAAKLDIVIDVLNGLSYAHRRGIIHRDIKPANIRVDQDGHARIMDFGVARLATSNLTSTGVMLGTPNYMAPEQITGGLLTPAVDLFAVGAMLYEFLTDVKPFPGDTLHSVLFKIVSDPPPDVGEVRPELPRQLTDIVTMALAKDPANRYKSAVEMANALSAVRATLGTQRLSKTVSQRVSIDKALRAQHESEARKVAARRWRIVAGSAAALVVVVAIGAVLLRRQTQASPASGATSPSTAAVGTTPAPAAGVALTDSAAIRRSTVADAAAATKGSGATLGQPKSQPTLARRDTAARKPLVGGATSQPAATTQGNASPQSAPVVPAPVPAPATPPAAAPPVTSPEVKPAAPTVESSRSAIASVIAAYARAIGTRDVAAVRRVHAGMTPQQQSGWESFFTSIRSMNATFDIASLDVSGNSAIARLTGMYDYVTKSGRPDRQPISLQATLQLDGDRWTLQTVR